MWPILGMSFPLNRNKRAHLYVFRRFLLHFPFACFHFSRLSLPSCCYNINGHGDKLPKKELFCHSFRFSYFFSYFFPSLTFSYGANSCKNVNSGKGFSGYITFKQENVHLSREYSLAFNFYKVFFYINVSLSSLSHLSFSIKRNAFLV